MYFTRSIIDQCFLCSFEYTLKYKIMIKKNYLNLLLLVAIAFVLGSCAPGNEKFTTEVAGFWMGLWHGFISFFTFIISLFNDDFTIYELNNSGKLYNLGFILGIAIFYGGGSKSSCGKRR